MTEAPEAEVQLNLRIPAKLRTRLKVAAAASDRSMTELVVEAIAQLLQRMEAQP